MACGKNYRAVPFCAGCIGNTFHYAVVAVVGKHKRCYPCIEVHFTTGGYYCLSHGFYHRRQPVGANVRMCVDQYFGLRSMLMKCAEHTFDRATLFASGIKFSVGVSTGAAFAKAIIGVGVHHTGTVDCNHIGASAVDIFSSFENYRTYTEQNKFKCCEKSCRAGTYYDCLWFVGHRRIYSGDKFNCSLVDRVDMDNDCEIYVYLPLSGIYRAACDISPFYTAGI